MHFDISFDDLDLHLRSQLYEMEQSKTSVSTFFEILQLNEIQYVATTCWFVEGLLKLMLNLFCKSNIQWRKLCSCDFIRYLIYMIYCSSNIQGREPCLCGFIKCTSNIITCESICLNLGI